MSSFANQRFDTFEDEFDLDMELGAAPPHPADAAASREPLQFLSPTGAAAPAADPEPSHEPLPAAVPERPAIAPVETSLAPMGNPAAGYNPVGELVASAQGALGEVMVPRIAIHVFAERQDTLAAAERAGQDRRLARASTQIRVGGVPAAVESYGHEPTPPLIVVECLSDPQTLLGEIERLAEVCDMGTKVVVIGATNDILLYRELMRRGVSEYLVAPIQPLQLISAIGGLFSDPAQPFVGRTIAFVADALSQPDRVDATLLDRMMVRCTDKLSLFAAPATLDGDWDIPSEAFEEVTTQIRGTAPFVVLDLPHIWSGWMRRTLISADEVVVVATPDLASLRNAKNMIDLIKQARPNDAPPRLVLNQVGAPGRPEIPAKEFGAAIGVHPSLTIPFDAKLFGAAANNGQMILDAGAKSKPAEGFETLAQIVTNRELPAAQTKGAKPGKPAKADKPAPAKGQSIFARFLKR